MKTEGRICTQREQRCPLQFIIKGSKQHGTKKSLASQPLRAVAETECQWWVGLVYVCEGRGLGDLWIVNFEYHKIKYHRCQPQINNSTPKKLALGIANHKLNTNIKYVKLSYYFLHLCIHSFILFLTTWVGGPPGLKIESFSMWKEHAHARALEHWTKEILDKHV